MVAVMLLFAADDFDFVSGILYKSVENVMKTFICMHPIQLLYVFFILNFNIKLAVSML